MRTAFPFCAIRGLRKWTAACLSLTVFAAEARDWPQYRGPNHDGVSTDLISKQWTGTATNALWRVFLGNGVTGFTVSGGRVLTQVHRDADGADMEVCVALDSTTGAELWATPVDDIVAYDGGVGSTDDGPRSTPTLDGESVYVLTSYLKLLRLNAANGVLVWSNDLRITYGGNVIGWQNAASPLIENGLIYLNANCGTSTLMALRETDGSLAWRSQNEAMTHSTPVLTTMNGVRQLIFATQNGLVSLDPQTGSLLWQTNYPFGYTTSLAASPAVYSNLVFITGQYGQGSAAFEILYTNATHVPRRLWSSTAHQSHWSTPVCYQGCVFGQFTPDDWRAQLRCLDLRTGAVKWAVDNFGRGSVLLVDDHLLVITERGDLVLARPNTNAYTEVTRFLAMPYFHTDTNKCWNAPAVSDGKVYVRSTSRETSTHHPHRQRHAGGFESRPGHGSAGKPRPNSVTYPVDQVDQRPDAHQWRRVGHEPGRHTAAPFLHRDGAEVGNTKCWSAHFHPQFVREGRSRSH
jgi:outer membrane protein assembly factor BamB